MQLMFNNRNVVDTGFDNLNPVSHFFDNICNYICLFNIYIYFVFPYQYFKLVQVLYKHILYI